MLADTRLHTQHSTTVQAMREATFLVALVSYMAVVIIALALMVNHLAASSYTETRPGLGHVHPDQSPESRSYL